MDGVVSELAVPRRRVPSHRMAADVEVVSPTGGIPGPEVPAHLGGVLADELRDRRFRSHSRVVAEGVNGEGHEEEMGSPVVGGQHGALEEGELEDVLAVVVPELGVGGVGVGEEDAGEGRGGIEGIWVDEDLERLHHFLEPHLKEPPVMVGSPTSASFCHLPLFH